MGGIVRDILLGYPVTDLDITIEHKVDIVAGEYARAVGGRVKGRTRFGTCKVETASVGVLDFATARSEKYTHPGALPDVDAAAIEADLARRDFAINAMAVYLSPGHYGELLDPFDGWGGISRRELKVLHQDSFADDPTRILRGIRFAARYGYRFERRTLRQLRECLAAGCLNTISGKRIRRELALIFGEQKSVAGLRLLGRYGVPGRIDAALGLDAAKRKLVPACGRALDLFEHWTGGTETDRAVFWFGFLFTGLEPATARRLVRYFNLNRRASAACVWAAGKLQITGDGLARLEKPYAYEAVKLMRNVPIESLALLYALSASKARSIIRSYVRQWRHVKPSLTGRDLIGLGIRQGPAVGTLLERILELKLLGKLPTHKSEITFARQR